MPGETMDWMRCMTMHCHAPMLNSECTDVEDIHDAMLPSNERCCLQVSQDAMTSALAAINKLPLAQQTAACELFTIDQTICMHVVSACMSAMKCCCMRMGDDEGHVFMPRGSLSDGHVSQLRVLSAASATCSEW